MPFVSIIVPAYNHERFLTQRMESIFAQTFTDYEVIVLDDASTDESKAVIERYRHHPAVSRVVYNETNSGSAFKQWRKGLQEAKGEWIWIAESDDYSAPQLLDVLVKGAKADERVVLSYCQSNEVDESGKGWRDMRWFTDQADKQHWNEDFCADGTKELSDYLWQLNSIPNASAVLFKKNAYLNASPEFETMTMCGDWFLWIEILKQGKLCFSAKPLNFFRTHAATTRTYEKRQWQKRLGEEYTIARHLLTVLPAAQHKKIAQRVQGLLRSYCSTFTDAEVMKFIAKPSLYKGPFAFPAFMRTYLNHSLRQKAKRLLGTSFGRPRKHQLQQN